MSVEPHAKIAIHGVTRRFGGNGRAAAVVALAGVDLAIPAESIVCVVGPSGCGKTTLLNLIAGFDTPTDGEILVDGRPVKGIGPERAVVFQTPALFPWCTVYENVVFGARRSRKALPGYQERAHRLLAAVGLTGFERSFPYQVSVGMRQRVQIARALLMEPDVILMDEPFGALDYQTRLSMQELLHAIAPRYRSTIFFITHDVEEALYLGDRVVVMSRRPGRFIDDIEVPYPRPRDYSVTSDAGFQRLKDRVLSLIRAQHTISVSLDQPLAGSKR